MTTPAHLRNADVEEYPMAMASRIAAKFALPSPIEAFEFSDKGNINRHTYRLMCGTGNPPEAFLLQQINPQVFHRPAAVMEAMIACIEAQRNALRRRSVDAHHPHWDVIELIPTRAGSPYLVLEDRHGAGFWRLMRFIPNSQTYKSLSEIRDRTTRLHVARETGRGLALFADLTAGMDTRLLTPSLPGYRDTALYFSQLDAVLRNARTLDECADLLPEDPLVRESAAPHFRVHLPTEESRRRRERPEVGRALRLALENRSYALMLREGMARGRIRTVAIHGDTKLDNFLFDTARGNVKALIDLDTIMPHTWLTDWGDMVRSLCNVAGEKEPDLDRVLVDRDIFIALADGFLATAATVPDGEISLMVDAVRIIALELGIRFLTDYLRGDTYFKLAPSDPADLNCIRGLVQLTLFERLEKPSTELRDCLLELRQRATPSGSPPT